MSRATQLCSVRADRRASSLGSMRPKVLMRFAFSESALPRKDSAADESRLRSNSNVADAVMGAGSLL